MKKIDWQKWGAVSGRMAIKSVLFIYVLYWWGAIFYDGPLGQANFWNALLACTWVALLVFVWRKLAKQWQKVLSVFALSLLVIIPWSLIQPSNDRGWAQDFEKTGTVQIEGDVVTFSNYRDFDYTKGEDGEWVVNPRWITKTVRLSNLQGMDIFHDRFLGNLMAHPILSFDFGEDGHVCLSIETRREQGETFSPLGGLYKMFELQYIFASENDVVRVRTNVREEPVYLYHSSVELDRIRELFLSSVEVQNQLAEAPQFYNIVNANCTTSIRKQIPESERDAWDIRILLNGTLDKLLFEKGSIVSDGLSFEELRKQCYISEVAKAAHDNPDFSKKIREGRPGQK